jgi:carbonic anhydrase/acetyltransferase-like protein (isoleucine patch superfamily)
MPILGYREFFPEIGDQVSVAPDATVVGKVRLTGPARLAARAVLRGDQNSITAGRRFVIGERSTVHVEFVTPTHIGDDVWVGDDAVVHACTLGDGVRVESGGVVLSNARVGAGSIVAAGSLVTEGTEFSENSYIEGTPGRRTRETTAAERQETLRLCSEPSRT